MIDPTHRISYKQLEGLSLALLKACGITDTHDIVSVNYRHHVSDMPHLEVEYVVKPDWETVTVAGMELRTITIPFAPVTPGAA